MTMGVLRAFNEHGRRVPDDVSLVGFDDIPESGYLSPPLTTVRQPFDTVGRRSLQTLLSEIETGQAVLDRVVISPELVIRESTARPRSDVSGVVSSLDPAIGASSRTLWRAEGEVKCGGWR